MHIDGVEIPALGRGVGPVGAQACIVDGQVACEQVDLAQREAVDVSGGLGIGEEEPEAVLLAAVAHPGVDVRPALQAVDMAVDVLGLQRPVQVEVGV